MVAKLSARQSKRLCGHQHCGSKSAASQLLAIAAMAFEHGNWLGGAFVTNRAASAAAGKWDFHRLIGLLFVHCNMCSSCHFACKYISASEIDALDKANKKALFC